MRGLAPVKGKERYQALVPLGGDDTFDAVRDSVAGLRLPLSRLEQRRHQVEELFRDENLEGVAGVR
jgi:ABC-2 type transport system ATP-binding protein